MIPATYNFSVVRGAAGPGEGLTVRLKQKDTNGVLSNLTFDDVRLTINKRKELLLRVTVEDGGLIVTNPGEAEVQWAPTPEQTRLVPIGLNKAQYELEIRQGTTESVYMMGSISGIGGINDDLGDVS